MTDSTAMMVTRTTLAGTRSAYAPRSNARRTTWQPLAADKPPFVSEKTVVFEKAAGRTAATIRCAANRRRLQGSAIDVRDRRLACRTRAGLRKPVPGWLDSPAHAGGAPRLRGAEGRPVRHQHDGHAGRP